MSEPKYESLQHRGMSSPFAELLGFEPVEQEVGRVLLRLPFSKNLLQSLGRVHGGAIFSLADHASGWAAYSTLETNERCATLEMKINYIAALNDENCLADSRVIHRGRTSIVIETDIKTEAGRLIAKTLATFIVLKTAD